MSPVEPTDPSVEQNTQPPSATFSAPQKAPGENMSKNAVIIAAGILISRIFGLLRQRMFGHYFGLSAEADVFTQAFKIPNFIQNVFGEGALSASFIPVYAKLLAEGDREEADRVADAVLTLLALLTSILVVLGIILAPYMIDFIAPGFQGEKREMTIRLVKIFFPGAGLLALSAWCLGILNSYRRFFLSYAAPVIWNCSIIAALIFFGNGTPLYKLAEITAWGSVTGSALQFVVQLPTVLLLIKRVRLRIDLKSLNVRAALHNFVPAFISRGIVQISAYVDSIIASFLGDGPVGLLQYSQTLYTIPVSLFGMSISAAELPAMASALGDETAVSAQLRERLNNGLKRIAVLIVPSSMAFLAFGDVLVAGLYQTGKFGHSDALYVWATLAGASVGLMASTLGRLYSSAFFALKDTRTPLKFAILRVILTIVLGYMGAIYLPPLLGLAIQWGTVGLTLTAGLAGWVEFILLRHYLNRKLGRTGLPVTFIIKLWTAAAIGAAFGWIIKLSVGFSLHPILAALLVLIPYGLIYFLMAALFKVKEAQAVMNQFIRRIPGMK